MKLVRGIILILLLSICMFPVVCQAAQVKSASNSKNEIPRGMNQGELHNAVMSFADNFIATVYEATIIVKN